MRKGETIDDIMSKRKITLAEMQSLNPTTDLQHLQGEEGALCVSAHKEHSHACTQIVMLAQIHASILTLARWIETCCLNRGRLKKRKHSSLLHTHVQRARSSGCPPTSTPCVSVRCSSAAASCLQSSLRLHATHSSSVWADVSCGSLFFFVTEAELYFHLSASVKNKCLLTVSCKSVHLINACSPPARSVGRLWVCARVDELL